MKRLRSWERLRAPRGPVGRALRRAGLTALGTYAAYTLHGLMHPSLSRQSATRAEREATMPGDELVPGARWVTNFATDVAATAREVWPWLVQMGYGRAGFYTWFPLDNGGVPSATRIVADLQGLAVGDVIPDGPRTADCPGVWRVVTLDRPHAMVLRSRRQLVDGREVPPDARGASFVDVSWAFVLSESAPGHTRVQVRVRGKFVGPTWIAPVTAAAQLLFALGDNTMENTLLAGLRARAELAG